MGEFRRYLKFFQVCTNRSGIIFYRPMYFAIKNMFDKIYGFLEILLNKKVNMYDELNTYKTMNASNN